MVGRRCPQFMAGDPIPFRVSLIVATRSRYRSLAPRLPVWKRAGFDEVIIVDGSHDRSDRARIRALCEETGSIYVPAPRRLRDTRSLSRNLGARKATSDWILFQDDDDEAVVSIEKQALRLAAAGKDWLAGTTGEIIVWHRRGSFLAFGGYPEDMVAAEDWIMSNRARRSGVGGLEPRWYDRAVAFPPTPEDPISRARNAFWYGFTLLLFILRCPKRDSIILGDARRIAVQLRPALREPRRFMIVAVGLFGRALSPFHSLGVLLRSGQGALRQEPYSGWKGVRIGSA